MRTEPPRNTGTDGDGVAQSEADHFQKCPVCSQWFDMRDLAQVADTSTMTARLKFWKDRDRRRARLPVPSIRHDFILHRSALPVETDKGAGMNCR